MIKKNEYYKISGDFTRKVLAVKNSYYQLK